MNVSEVLFALLRCEFMGQEISEEVKRSIDDAMLLRLYEYSKKQELAHVVYYTLSKNGLISDGEIKKKFKKQKTLAIYRCERLKATLDDIRRILSEAQIPFMPLKGELIRRFYPEDWMRTSCDIDVLVKEEELYRAIEALKKGGYNVAGKKEVHDISLYSGDNIHLELHFSLKGNIEKVDKVVDKVWEHSYLMEFEGYEYLEDAEFFLFHLYSHLYYHFMAGTVGIRPLLDIWMLKDKLTYDKDKFFAIIKEAKISNFTALIDDLIDVWFGGKAYDEPTKKMAKLLLSGGIYGSTQNKMKLSQAKSGGKNKRILRRIFMPYKQLKKLYPILETHKWLTPFYEVVRWSRLLSKNKFKAAIKEVRLGRKNSRNEIEEYKKLLKELDS